MGIAFWACFKKKNSKVRNYIFIYSVCFCHLLLTEQKTSSILSFSTLSLSLSVRCVCVFHRRKAKTAAIALLPSFFQDLLAKPVAAVCCFFLWHTHEHKHKHRHTQRARSSLLFLLHAETQTQKHGHTQREREERYIIILCSCTDTSQKMPSKIRSRVNTLSSNNCKTHQWLVYPKVNVDWCSESYLHLK